MSADEEKRADEETLPDTPLHAYAEGREEDVEGDVDELTSGDPKQLQQDELADEGKGEDRPEPATGS